VSDLSYCHIEGVLWPMEKSRTLSVRVRLTSCCNFYIKFIHNFLLSVAHLLLENNGICKNKKGDFTLHEIDLMTNGFRKFDLLITQLPKTSATHLTYQMMTIQVLTQLDVNYILEPLHTPLLSSDIAKIANELKTLMMHDFHSIIESCSQLII